MTDTTSSGGKRSLRLRFVAKLNPSKGEVRHLDPATLVSFVPMEAVGEYGGMELETERSISEVRDGYSYFRDGDVIVAKITPCFENGKGALAAGLKNGIAFGTTELHVLRPGADLHDRFLFYISMSDRFRRLGAADMYGAGGQKRISEDFVRNFVHWVPPLERQRAIAEFLDRETAKIDALVAKKEELIKLLQEKRTALITHAVTKGLDPNAPMKDSGIEWLGKIPAHWEVLALKRIASRVVVGIAEAATHAYTDDGVAIIRSTNVRQDGELSGELLQIERWFAEQNRSKYLRAGDLVTVRTGYPGTTAVVPDHLDKSQCFTLLISTPKRDQVAEFLSRFINSATSRAYFDLEGWGTAQTNISVPILQEMPIAVPPHTEQEEIVRHLSVETPRLDRLAARIESGIERLQELRAALIAAAVTGKFDVRGELA